ncbi:hypothetical protein K7432_017042 [Basidiobolus ranarum]|uniref:Uncharacterized protein n=1 Tax=Basidiobolus ranarum TaxID=34480 RepID=A0ABR2WDX4_9FUNG
MYVISELSDNGLVGQFFQKFGEFRSLNKLDLSKNSLTGSLPLGLSYIAGLEYLFYPQAYRSAEEAEDIVCILRKTSRESFSDSFENRRDLSENLLSGSIPYEMGDMPKLTEISLDGNRLIGTIPVQFMELANLQELYVQNNHLEGPVPPLTRELRACDFSNNTFYCSFREYSDNCPGVPSLHCKGSSSFTIVLSCTPD